MADKEESQETKAFYKEVIKQIKHGHKKWDGVQRGDEKWRDRTKKHDAKRISIMERSDLNLAKNSRWLKSQSEATQNQYETGLKTITNLKLMGQGFANFGSNFGKFMSQDGAAKSMMNQTAHSLNKKLVMGIDSLNTTLKDNRQQMKESMSRMPEMIVGGTITGFKSATQALGDRAKGHADKLLAYFGNKDARERMEEKAKERQADKSGLSQDLGKAKEKAKGFLGNMMTKSMGMATNLFKGLFGGIGKFLLKNIGKLGILGLATSLMAVFWDDISKFLSGIFSGDGEATKVTEGGVKDMLDKLWGFINDGIKSLFGVDLGAKMKESGVDVGEITKTISEYITPLVNGFIKIGTEVGKLFKDVFDSAFGTDGKPGKLSQFFDNMGKFGKSIIGALNTFTGGLFQDPKTGKPLEFDGVVELVFGTIKTFVNKMMDGALRISEYFVDPSALVADVKNAFSGLGRILSNVFTDIMITLKAYGKSLLPGTSYEEALAELKKENAEQKAKEAAIAERRLNAKARAFGVQMEEVTADTDIKAMMDKLKGQMSEEDRGVFEKLARDIKDAKEREREQTTEAIESAVEGEKMRQLEEYKRTNMVDILSSDTGFADRLKALSEDMRFNAVGDLDDSRMGDRRVQNFLQSLDPEAQKSFLSKLETLDNAGEMNEDTAFQLAKQIGLDTSKFDKEESLEFFKMLMDAENLKSKSGDTFEELYGSQIGDEQADRLLEQGFKVQNEQMAEVVRQLGVLNETNAQYVSAIAGIPQAVLEGSKTGSQQGTALGSNSREKPKRTT